MIAAEIKQYPDNIKALGKHEINGVIFKCQIQSYQNSVKQLIYPPIILSASFTP